MPVKYVNISCRDKKTWIQFLWQRNRLTLTQMIKIHEFKIWLLLKVFFFIKNEWVNERFCSIKYTHTQILFRSIVPGILKYEYILFWIYSWVTLLVSKFVCCCYCYEYAWDSCFRTYIWPKRKRAHKFKVTCLLSVVVNIFMSIFYY